MIDEGDTAPEFSLRGYHDGGFDTYRLHDALDEGNHVLLAFYYCDFSPVCTKQMCDYSDANWYGYKTNLDIFGVSRDGPYSHKRFAEENGIEYPLLADIEGEACEAFGVLEADTTADDLPGREDEVNGVPGMPRRSVFMIAPDRTVTYAWRTEDNWESPAVNHIERAVESM